MKRLLPLALALIPGLSWGQFALKLWERSIALDADEAIQAEFLTNGSFAVLVGDYQTSRIYISTRANTVTSVTPLNAFVTKMLTDSTGIYAIGVLNQNSYFVKLGFDGKVIWSRVMDASGISLRDSATVLALAPNGNLIVGGKVLGTTNTYGFVAGLNATTGAIVFRATNAPSEEIVGIGVTQNGQIHAASRVRYWRLNGAGATQQSNPWSPTVNIYDLDARGDTVFAAGWQNQGSRKNQYLQRRSDMGAFMGGAYDSFGAGADLGVDSYDHVLVDSTGHAIASGRASQADKRYARVARWNQAPALVGNYEIWEDSEFIRDTRITLDKYDHVYWVTTFDRRAANKAYMQLNKLTTPWIYHLFTGLVRTTTTNSLGGFCEGLAVDNTSGDIVVPYRDFGSLKWQLWRQAAEAIDDVYVVPGPGFNSPSPVTLNDRYASDCVLEVVSYPSKGGLTMAPNGTFAYGRYFGQSGQDFFSYRLRKNGLAGTVATVTLHLL